VYGETGGIARLELDDGLDVDAPLQALDRRILKEVESHAHSVALHFLHCSFARFRTTLRVTPAMEALATHVWGIEDVVVLLTDALR
jgi:hypothetical protein